MRTDIAWPRCRFLELCYNIRYIDENNRGDPKAPWSERQIAVYHQHTFASNQSAWIILQAPDRIKRQLRDFVAVASGTTFRFLDQLSLHVMLFTSLTHGWRDYINFLESQLVELVECSSKNNFSEYWFKDVQDDKALYSKVGSSRRFDFLVTFQDVQNLEIVRRKLVKALLNLRSNADVGRCWIDRLSNLCSSLDHFDLGENLEMMQEYVLDLERHARVVDLLLSRIDGTRKLVRLLSTNFWYLTAEDRALSPKSSSKSSSTGMTSFKFKRPKRYNTTETNWKF